MPDPLRAEISELFSGNYDSQWVETDGIVQSVGRQGANAYLSIVSGPTGIEPASPASTSYCRLL
jgi:hypothetical protein